VRATDQNHYWQVYNANGLMHKVSKRCINIDHYREKISLKDCDRHSKTQLKLINKGPEHGYQLGLDQGCLASNFSKKGDTLIIVPCVNGHWAQLWHSPSLKTKLVKFAKPALTGALSKGKLISISQGDIACYLELEDRAKKRHLLMANFDLCDEILLDKQVDLVFTMKNVMAASYAGDMNCKELEQVLMITSMTLSTVAFSHSLCRSDEDEYVGCETKNGKIISFCTQKSGHINLHETPRYMQVRYGSGEHLEFEFPQKMMQSANQFKTILSRYAGSNSRFLAYFKTAEIEYLYEDAYIDADHINGVGIWKKGENMRFIACTAHRSKDNNPSDIIDNELFY